MVEFRKTEVEKRKRTCLVKGSWISTAVSEHCSQWSFPAIEEHVIMIR